MFSLPPSSLVLKLPIFMNREVTHVNEFLRTKKVQNIRIILLYCLRLVKELEQFVIHCENSS